MKTIERITIGELPEKASEMVLKIQELQKQYGEDVLIKKVTGLLYLCFYIEVEREVTKEERLKREEAEKRKWIEEKISNIERVMAIFAFGEEELRYLEKELAELEKELEETK